MREGRAARAFHEYDDAPLHDDVLDRDFPGNHHGSPFRDADG
jgi:hypothetical protein